MFSGQHSPRRERKSESIHILSERTDDPFNSLAAFSNSLTTISQQGDSDVEDASSEGSVMERWLVDDSDHLAYRLSYDGQQASGDAYDRLAAISRTRESRKHALASTSRQRNNASNASAHGLPLPAKAEHAQRQQGVDADESGLSTQSDAATEHDSDGGNPQVAPSALRQAQLLSSPVDVPGLETKGTIQRPDYLRDLSNGDDTSEQAFTQRVSDQTESDAGVSQRTQNDSMVVRLTREIQALVLSGLAASTAVQAFSAAVESQDSQQPSGTGQSSQQGGNANGTIASRGGDGSKGSGERDKTPSKRSRRSKSKDDEDRSPQRRRRKKTIEHDRGKERFFVCVLCEGLQRDLGLCKVKDGVLRGWKSRRFSDLMGQDGHLMRKHVSTEGSLVTTLREGVTMRMLDDELQKLSPKRDGAGQWRALYAYLRPGIAEADIPSPYLHEDVPVELPDQLNRVVETNRTLAQDNTSLSQQVSSLLEGYAALQRVVADQRQELERWRSAAGALPAGKDLGALQDQYCNKLSPLVDSSLNPEPGMAQTPPYDMHSNGALDESPAEQQLPLAFAAPSMQSPHEAYDIPNGTGFVTPHTDMRCHYHDGQLSNQQLSAEGSTGRSQESTLQSVSTAPTTPEPGMSSVYPLLGTELSKEQILEEMRRCVTDRSDSSTDDEAIVKTTCRGESDCHTCLSASIQDCHLSIHQFTSFHTSHPSKSVPSS